MVQNLAFYVMNFTNTAFIGHYRIDGLSAINNAMIPFFMFFSFFIALSQGTTIMIAQSIGAGNQKASEVAETSFFYNQLISLGYFFFWFFSGKQVLVLMGAQGEILEMGARYVQVMSFVFITRMNLTASSVYQGIGKTIPIMVITIIRSLSLMYYSIICSFSAICGKRNWA